MTTSHRGCLPVIQDHRTRFPPADEPGEPALPQAEGEDAAAWDMSAASAGIQPEGKALRRQRASGVAEAMLSPYG